MRYYPSSITVIFEYIFVAAFGLLVAYYGHFEYARCTQRSDIEYHNLLMVIFLDNSAIFVVKQIRLVIPCPKDVHITEHAIYILQNGGFQSKPTFYEVGGGGLVKIPTHLLLWICLHWKLRD